MDLLAERSKYFTINRPRQYGKTTTLSLLESLLADEYFVIDMSFEEWDTYFESLS
jgi:predicted AAA+ superfamily ATPase